MLEQKKLLRQEILSRRKGMGEKAREAASERICGSVITWLDVHMKKRNGGTLFSYLPFGDEVNVVPILEWCWREGIETAIPRIISGTREMDLHLIQGLEGLASGVWGIREPRMDSPKLQDFSRIGCILVPGLGFDAELNRLGYGGGYYDRFFEKLETARLSPPKLAPAFDVQMVPKVPKEAHDYKVNAIVTETKWIEHSGERLGGET